MQMKMVEIIIVTTVKKADGLLLPSAEIGTTNIVKK